ncbi:MAG: hypothetical protein QNJ47_05540 [Nostocaceae cyanobacterium]|nr:hypothetical protein [Nostocaceae cyanobacterium]
MKRFVCIFSISTMLSFASYSSVIAGEARRNIWRISQEIATGNSSAEIPLIELSPGYGVNISFINSGEIVEKVWLDNPIFASLDVDGCLSGLGRECNSPGATVLHLRRIKPLNVPQLPKTNSSLLTVVARGKSGRRVYVFRVTMGSVKPKYHTIEVTPTTNTESKIANLTRNINITRNINGNITSLFFINRGLKIAQKQRLILPTSSLYQRIEQFLISVKTGDAIDDSARKNGISLQLVNRLIELGRGKRKGAGSRV